jgi:hypothetical protein
MQGKVVPSTTWGEQACRAKLCPVPLEGTGLQGKVVPSTTWGNRHAGQNCTQYHLREQAHRTKNRTEYHVREQECRAQSYSFPRGGKCRAQSYSVPRGVTGMQVSIVLSISWGNRQAGHICTQYHVGERTCRAQSYSVPSGGTGVQSTIVHSNTWGNRHAGNNRTHYHDVGEQACRAQSFTGRCRSPYSSTFVLQGTDGQTTMSPLTGIWCGLTTIPLKR